MKKDSDILNSKELKIVRTFNLLSLILLFYYGYKLYILKNYNINLYIPMLFLMIGNSIGFISAYIRTRKNLVYVVLFPILALVFLYLIVNA